MAVRRLDEEGFFTGEERHLPQSQPCAEEPAEDDAQEIGTACYLCYGQCVNYGVQGPNGRPCARGVTGIIERRRMARSAEKKRSPDR